ncbi:MAG: hypothetical protein JWN76_522 [Chitinophagaceae bacterium]|nr:hypothetical protein [Chitinophagaceae bacterium]
MNIKRNPYYLFIVFCLFASSSFAQTFTAAFDRGKILIGEQVILSVKLESFDPSLQMFELWRLPDSVNHLEIVKRLPLDTVVIGGTQTFIQQFAVTSFDSGGWEFPAIAIKITDRQSGKITTLSSQPLPLSVLPVNVSDLKDYHDIKDILEVEKQFDWTLFIYIAAGLLLLILLWLILKRKKKPRAKPVVNPRDALQTALEDLRELERSSLQTAGEIRMFLIKLDIIVRTYIEQTQGIPALHQTTDELMISLNTLPAETIRTQFFQVLRLMAAVKFAKFNASAQTTSAALPVVRETIQYMAANKK